MTDLYILYYKPKIGYRVGRVVAVQGGEFLLTNDDSDFPCGYPYIPKDTVSLKLYDREAAQLLKYEVERYSSERDKSFKMAEKTYESSINNLIARFENNNHIPLIVNGIDLRPLPSIAGVKDLESFVYKNTLTFKKLSDSAALNLYVYFNMMEYKTEIFSGDGGRRLVVWKKN